MRWVDPEQLHLTLAFLGSMPAEGLPALAAALWDVAQASAPFRVTLDGAGRFRGRGRQEVAWIGLDDGRTACTGLAERVIAACRRSGALPLPSGAERDGTPTPHLTVARRAPATIPTAIDAALVGQRLGWTADSIVLYRSHLGAPAVRYEVLLRLSLGHEGRRAGDLPEHDGGG